MREIPKECQ